MESKVKGIEDVGGRKLKSEGVYGQRVLALSREHGGIYVFGHPVDR